jgi:hypothetical protein
LTEEEIIRLSILFETTTNTELNDIRVAKKNGYIQTIKSCPRKLWEYKNYIETKGFQLKFWEQYTLSKYFLKNWVIENICDKDFDDGLKEEALYEWLQICVNPHDEINYDFFFEKYKNEFKIDKEQEIQNILFVKEEGKVRLRNLFNNDDWHIRLKTIENWFLKRYDRETAQIISRCRKSTLFEKIKLFYPRFIGAIIIGLLQMFLNNNSYITKEFSIGKLTFITIALLALSFSYLFYECYNITNNLKISLKRSFILCIFSFWLLSIILMYIIYYLYDIKYSLNSFLISSAAIFIGIFIQILWEEKTITEPL